MGAAPLSGMSEPGNLKTQPDLRPTAESSAPAQPWKPPGEASKATSNGFSNSGQKAHYPNPRETVNPDAVTLRDQWWYAMRQYGKWFSHAWGTAILAGVAFFALGWIVKGAAGGEEEATASADFTLQIARPPSNPPATTEQTPTLLGVFWDY